ncbi:MAG: hypothetical protein IPF54_12760 [Draconibacterium sp.]|nr:hypothetical protein [Draconibacterium sp.]
MKTIMFFKIVLSIICMLLITVHGFTQIVNVNSYTGNDISGDGSFRNPFKTFTKGYVMVPSEGTMVLTGTFTWTNIDEMGDDTITGFTISKNITIEGFGNKLAIVQAATKSGDNKSRVFTISPGSTVTFKNLEIRYGYISGTNDGGGITIGCYSNVNVLNCYIHHNSARQGFAIESLNSNLCITNSTISDNSFNNGTVNAGGAIDAQEGAGTTYGINISNSTVCNNTGASYGGGISVAFGVHYITSCTIVDNTSTLEGGGISIAGGDSHNGDVYIKNSIVANNISTTTVAEDYDDSFDGMTYDNGYNIVEFHNSPNFIGAGTITGEQANLFGRGICSTPPLSDNNPTNGTPCLELATGSVAINAGNALTNGVVSTLRTDQRGLDRVGKYDVGAYEYGAVSKTVPTVCTTTNSSSEGISATIGGVVVTEGGTTVSARGVIYSITSTNANSKISGIGDNRIFNGSGTGSFSTTISNLLPNTNYYVQTFATNSIGTSYGNVVSFNTGMGELTWNGSKSCDWETSENWTPAITPSVNYNVIIPAGLTNYPIVARGGVCNNLTIESTSTGTGSLIGQSNLTVNGIVAVQHYMTGIDKRQQISSPVVESISNFINSNLAVRSTNSEDNNLQGLVIYDNSDSSWSLNTTNRNSDHFTPGKGYEILKTSEGNVTFTGTLAIGDVSIPITSPKSPGNAWNLIGNPFPSAINANSLINFLSVNADAIHDSYKAIYIWDAASGKYNTVNSSSGPTYIEPGQAFFVYSVDGGSTINFTEAMQTHRTVNLLKDGEMPSPSIKLIAEQSQGISSTNILYLEDMTTGLDPGYDAGRFTLEESSFTIYTHLVGDKSNTVDFDIQCLPSDNFDYVIPVGLNAPANTELIFRAEALNLPMAIPVILEDRLNRVFTNLTEAGSYYKVTVSSNSEGTGRFFIHTNQSASSLINPDPNAINYTIIPRPQFNTLNVIGNTENIAEITVYDMLGRKLLHSLLQRDGASEIEMGDLKVEPILFTSILQPKK